ncbi:MAG: hypothetical protein NZ919_02135 [Candidatus Caldarchaeum sp.]|nr:hypothetical protein [Candidatus Caldarchaeum sp.]
MSSPRELPYAAECGDKELYLFSLKVSDIPGALRQVLEVIASYGLNLVSVYTNSPYRLRDQSDINLVVDFTNKPLSAEQLAKSLQLLGVVKNVMYYGKQLPDMLVDVHHFPVTIMGERAIIYREPGYREMILGIKRELGTGGDAILYRIGLNIGRGIWKKVKELAKGDLKLMVEHIKDRVLQNGTSRVKEIILELDAGRVVVRLEDNYECALVKNYGKPFSNLHRGMFAGIFSELTGSELSIETKCIAAGDPYCEFIIGETD